MHSWGPVPESLPLQSRRRGAGIVEAMIMVRTSSAIRTRSLQAATMQLLNAQTSDTRIETNKYGVVGITASSFNLLLARKGLKH